MNGLVVTAKSRIDGLKRGISNAGGWLTATPLPETAIDALAFLDPIDQICAEPAPRYMRSVLYAIVSLFLGLLLIGALIKVDIVVSAGGKLVTSTPPVLLQPVERAIIRELRVRPGDVVHKGEVLATLDPTFARADLGALAAQRQSLQAQKNRLEAELNGQTFEIGKNPTDDQKLQATLFEQRQANYRSRLRVFSEDIAKLMASIQSAEKDGALLSSQLAVGHDVEEMYSTLLKSQNGSRLNYLNAQALRMRTERDYQDSVSRLAELKHEVQSQMAQQQAFIEDWRRQILENLASAQTQLSMTSENMSKATFINDLVVVIAPVDGVVLDVAQRSVGSILHEAEPLITIVPSDAKLVADIGISTSDVGSTKAGDTVLIKIDAFPYSRHGLVIGKLLYISEESFATNSLTGQVNNSRGEDQFHRGQVELVDTALKNMPEGAHLIPGMTLHAEIKVGSRSILGFLLSPVTRGLGEALREP